MTLAIRLEFHWLLRYNIKYKILMERGIGDDRLENE